MKDECNGKIMTEFIVIRSKMYAYQMEDGREEKKGKGIKKHLVKKKLELDHYRDCVMSEKVFRCSYNNISSKKHQIYSTVNNKLALSPMDDKRYLLNSIDSLSHGHYTIKNI